MCNVYSRCLDEEFFDILCFNPISQEVEQRLTRALEFIRARCQAVTGWQSVTLTLSDMILTIEHHDKDPSCGPVLLKINVADGTEIYGRCSHVGLRVVERITLARTLRAFAYGNRSIPNGFLTVI